MIIKRLLDYFTGNVKISFSKDKAADVIDYLVKRKIGYTYIKNKTDDNLSLRIKLTDYHRIKSGLLVYEVVAETPSTLAMVNPEVLVVTNEAFVTVQHKMLVNLMAAQRQLFMSLSQHLICLSQKTIRDKVLRYLQIKSEAERSYEFTLSLSREDMASYLSVDRASLSRTLGELKREGVIDFRKNHFKILSTQYFKY